MTEPIHVISLGAGVQSSTMAEMASAGYLTPMPIAAYFADTQAEPASVYRWLEWLEKRLPFPVHRVTAGSLERAELIVRRSKKSGKLYSNNKIPAFTSGAKNGILGRKCTREFKIDPIRRALRKVVGIHGKRCTELRVIQWIGISIDEAHRIKPSREPWIEYRYPLIEKRLSRRDCIQYWEERGLPKPPRSACVFCPYHNDGEWLRLKLEEPQEFARAVEFEKNLQAAAARSEVLDGVPYLHDSRKPLDQVEFVQKVKQPDLFGNECEGMCGV